MNVRRTLDELGDLAVTQIGFCIGIHWRSVTGSRVPTGMVSARCRLAYVLFSGFAPAERFHALLDGSTELAEVLARERDDEPDMDYPELVALLEATARQRTPRRPRR